MQLVDGGSRGPWFPAGKNFFLQKMDTQVLPPPRIFWAGLNHLKNEQAKGVGVFLMWMSITMAVKFLNLNHLINFVICFRNIDTKLMSHSEAKFNFFNSTSAIIF